MKHGIYIGDDLKLFNEPALIRDDDYASTNLVLAQFDNMALSQDYTHGWVSFHAGEFKYDPPSED